MLRIIVSWFNINSFIINFFDVFLQPYIVLKCSIKTHFISPSNFPFGNYLFKVNSRNTRIRCEICSKLIIKTPERRQWRPSGVFIVNFEHIYTFFSVSIVTFEQVNAGWIHSYPYSGI